MARDFDRDDARRADPYADAGRADRRDHSGDADHEDAMDPVDIMAVRRDDALIDAIAGDGPVSTDSDDEYLLAGLLADWRSELMAAPLPERPDLDEVAAAVEAVIAADELHRRRTRNRLRLLRPVAGAAAAVAFVIGGMTAFSYSAVPGDPLWKVKEVVFTQQADSTVARVDTTNALEEVEAALARGDAQVATTRLAQAAERAPAIRDEEQRAQIESWWARLSSELSRLTPPPPPPAPPAPTSTAPTRAPVVPTVPSVPGDVIPSLPEVPPVAPPVIPSWPLPTTLQLPTDLQLPPFFPPEQTVPTTPAPTTTGSPLTILRVPASTPTLSVPLPLPDGSN